MPSGEQWLFIPSVDSAALPRVLSLACFLHPSCWFPKHCETVGGSSVISLWPGSLASCKAQNSASLFWEKKWPLTWGPWSLHFSLHSTKLFESFSDSLSLSSNSPESRRRPVLQPSLKMSKCPKRKNHRLLVTRLPKGFLSLEFYFISSLLFSQLDDIFKRDCLNMSNVLLGVVQGCTDCPNYHILPKLNFAIYGSYWKVKKSSKCGYEMKHNVYRNVAKYDWREGKCHCLLVCQWSLR